MPKDTSEKNASEKWRYCGPIQSVQTEKTLDLQGIPQADSYNRNGVTFVFIIWTIGCAFMLYAWIHSVFFPENEKYTIYELIFIFWFLSAFWAVWILLFVSWFQRLQYRWEILHLSPDGLDYTLKWWIPFFFTHVTVSRRHFSLNEIGMTKMFLMKNDCGLEFPTEGKPFRCLVYPRSDAEPGAFIKQINEHLRQLGVTEKKHFNIASASPVELRFGRWKVEENGSSIILRRRAWIPFLHLGAACFVCHFVCSGITLLTIFFGGFLFSMLTSPKSLSFPNDELFSFGFLIMPTLALLFLIPFNLFSIAIQATTISLFLQYVRRDTIAVDEHGVKYRSTYLGLGLSRYWPIDHMGKATVVEKREKYALMQYFNTLRFPDSPDSHCYSVRLSSVQDEAKQIGRIPELSHKEAKQICALIRSKAKTS